MNHYIFAGLNAYARRSISSIKKPISFDLIADVIELELQVSFEQIMSKTRIREVVTARHLFNYFCRKYTNKSLNEIARHLGLNHATIIHSVKVVNNLCDTEKEFFNNVQKIEAHFNK